jgi:hypothetical protein
VLRAITNVIDCRSGGGGHATQAAMSDHRLYEQPFHQLRFAFRCDQQPLTPSTRYAQRGLPMRGRQRGHVEATATQRWPQVSLARTVATQIGTQLHQQIEGTSGVNLEDMVIGEPTYGLRRRTEQYGSTPSGG